MLGGRWGAGTEPFGPPAPGHPDRSNAPKHVAQETPRQPMNWPLDKGLGSGYVRLAPATSQKPVLARKICTLPFEPPAIRFVAFDLKATKCPSALSDGKLLIPFPWGPPGTTEIMLVLGVHPAGAPKQVSWAYACAKPFVFPGTRLVANDVKVTKRP